MKKLPSQADFLEEYRLEADAFAATEIIWTDLEALFDDYLSLKPDLESIGESMSNRLMKLDKVHSVRYRIKDEEHLIAKVIRKRIDNADRIITVDNYLSEITDLVGLRAIHLFKEDWESIHEGISQTWDLKETVKAYIREGDNELYKKAFSDKGLTVEDHKRGYRSIHYITRTRPAKTEYFAEIQVRTIFEEGWSEIDHSVRYPYELNNLLYKEFSLILNRLAGSADEMGSFITLLRNEINKQHVMMLAKQEENEKLQAIIDKSNMDETEKKEVKKGLSDAAALNTAYLTAFEGIVPPSFASSFAGLDSVSKFSGLKLSPDVGLIAKAIARNNHNWNSMSELIKRATQINSTSALPGLKGFEKVINPKAASDDVEIKKDNSPKEEPPQIE